MTATSSSIFAQFTRELSAPLQSIGASRQAPFSAAAVFAQAFHADPVLVALSAFEPSASIERRAGILLTILASPAFVVPEAERATVHRVTQVLLRTLPVSEVLAVFSVLRRERVNHRHARRAIVQTLSQHEQREALMANHRATVRELLEHAFGRNTLRGQVKRGAFSLPFISPEAAQAFIPRLFARGEATARRVALRIPPVEASAQAMERPARVTAFNRGDVSAAIVQQLQGGSTPELEVEVVRRAEQAARELPFLEGHLAVVLDTSASMVGYGDRRFTAQAQAQALRLVFEQRARSCSVVRVGEGSGFEASGATDLASAVLEAQRQSPAAVVVITDGYENTARDLASVLASLEAAQVGAPVVLIAIGFTWKDDLRFRQPVPGRVTRLVWHQAEFAQVWREVLAAAGPVGRGALKAELERSLRSVELQTWEVSHDQHSH